MPGLRQLEKFSNDIRQLGNEPEIRKKRGEPIFNEPLPDTYEEDDSDDFLDGLPSSKDEADGDGASGAEGTGGNSGDGAIGAEIDDDVAAETDNILNDLLGGGDVSDSDGFDELSGTPAPDAPEIEIPESETIQNDPLGEDVFGGETLNSSDELSSGEIPTEIPSEEIPSMEEGIGDGTEDEMTIPADASGFEQTMKLGGSEDETVLGGEDSGSGSDYEDILGNMMSENSGNDDGFETPNPTETVEDDTSFGEDTFDPSVLNDLDGFTDGDAGTSSDGDSPDSEFQVTGESDDFALADDFDIDGFTNTDTADMGRKKVDTVDFSKAKIGKDAQAQKTSLTEAEYERFKKNLSEYPLNLKIVIEETIAKDDSSSFTDEIIFEIIDKVLKKTPVRTLAGDMEKLLDISINIPRDFEHRTFEQYEAYKASFQYQLKNRIIPAAVILALLCVVGFGLFKIGQKTIYEPIMARLNYREGYEYLQKNAYPQSEEKFEKAVSYRPVRKWFFNYARGYREHKQYERAAKMYKNILVFFNFDKEAGLEYASMELYDRANYAEAENIVRRYVLDKHINAPEGELLLGDIFLEWADVDPSKYDDALEFYSDLHTKFPEDKLYLSRMLRYYIRTDQLRNVLEYKNLFYPKKKSLSSQDWTELSGYLLEKLYGPLSRNDEYLRASIEDVRSMLEIAVNADPSNPVARYNLARYFIYNGYDKNAKVEMQRAINLFDQQVIRTKRNVYSEINASRLLGEIYSNNKEYIEASKVFTQGINLYNDEHLRTDFEGDENTGKLFEDMADIDYFITGDIDSALTNYEAAVKTKNDTPGINFRIGVIRYGRKEYDAALDSFIKVAEGKSSDTNLLISLANLHSLRGNNFAAQSYYQELLEILDAKKAKLPVLEPQKRDDDNKMVDLYVKANNNLGVTLYRLAKQTGSSDYYARSLVCFSDSMRAWDSMTRDQRTMVKMDGGNLAAVNSKNVMHPIPDYEPSIYTDIPKILTDEKVLEQ